MAPKKVFLVAYEFPPLNMGGEQRPLKFVKYLREYGIEPVVFALDPASYPVVFGDYNADLETLGQIPEGVEIVRVPSEDIVVLRAGRLKAFLSTWFRVVPLEAQGWSRHFKRIFSEQYQRHRPELLMVTAPPFSLLPLCVTTARQYGLPLIVDMRDAWSAWNLTPYGSFLHYRLTLAKERQCLSAADAVIATSDQTLTDFERLHPMIAPNVFHLITNGYDRDIDDWTPCASGHHAGPFTIGYVGSFYYSPEGREQMFTPWWRKRGHRMLQYVPCREDWLYRTPYFFFRTLRALISANPDLESRVQIKFAGRKPAWFDAMVSEFALDRVVSHVGALAHRESLSFQAGCDALLVTSSKVLGGQDYSIAGKTYEYLSMKKPILGFVAEGAQKRLLEQTGMALICNPDAVDQSAESLKRLLDGKWKPVPRAEFLDSLHRRALTAKLAKIITGVAACRS